MNRRSFLKFLCALPVVGRVFREANPPSLVPEDFTYIEGYQAFPLQEGSENIFYVNGLNGEDDIKRAGSILQPFRTISFAVSRCINRDDSIVVLGGISNGLRT